MKNIKTIVITNVIITILFAILMMFFIKTGVTNLTICNEGGCSNTELLDKNILDHIMYRLVTILSLTLFIISNIVSILMYKLQRKK